MMTDIALLNALTAFARSIGLIGERDRLVIETEATQAVPRCLKPSPPGKLDVVLLCSRPEGHASPQCSWEAAFVGIAAPVDWSNVTLTTESPEIRCQAEKDGVQCAKLRGHEDLHIRPDGTVMIWRADEPGKRPEFDPAPRCHAVDGCIHEAGHRGDHETPRGGDDGPWRSCEDVAVLPGGYHVSCRQRRGHSGDHSEGPTSWGRRPEKQGPSPHPIAPRT